MVYSVKKKISLFHFAFSSFYFDLAYLIAEFPCYLVSRKKLFHDRGLMLNKIYRFEELTNAYRFNQLENKGIAYYNCIRNQTSFHENVLFWFF